MNKRQFTIYKKYFFTSLFVVYCLLLITPVQAAEPAPYQMLAELPLVVEKAAGLDINTYIPNMVKLVIGIAGALAILRIIFGGIQYMTSDAFDKKSSAKETINNALLGLLLAMSAYIILRTVNPKLVEFDFSVAGLKVGAPISTDLGATTPLGETISSSCVVSGGGTSPCTCINCVNSPEDFDFKNGTTLNADLAVALKKVRSNTNFGWRITEAWPPSSPHQSRCHYDGSCVDINLTRQSYISGTPTRNQVMMINLMGRALRNEGLGVSFEVREADLSALKTAGVDSHLLQNFYTNTTGVHFHVTW